ncbi:hypothetical protein [Synechococcus phage MinM1]|nr:hypothetical protein [Synechococcus phage MinM1]
MSGSTGRGYSFRISAEGMQEFAADIRRLAAESEGVQQAFSKLIQASPELASSLTRAEEATKRAADHARDLREANERAAAAAASLPASTARAADAFDRLEGRALAARRGLADFRGALELLGAGSVAGALGPVASQIGNVADAFSTAALAARAGTSALGMVVPVLGAAAAAAGGLYTAYQVLQSQAASYGTEQERLNRILEGAAESQNLYRRAIEATNDLVEDAEERSVRLANARRAEQRATLEATAAEQEREAALLAARAANLPGSIAAAGEDAGAYAALGFPGVPAAERENTIRFLEGQVRLVRERTEALAAERAEIQRRLEALGDGVVRYARPIGPELPPTGRGGAAARSAGPDATTRMVDANARRAEQEAERAAERARAATEAEERRRAEAVRRFEQQSLDAFARIGETALERIGGSLVDAFIRGERAALNFGNILRASIASAATDLLRLGAINPLANAVFGTGRPTLGGAFSALSGSGGLSGLGSLGSLGSSLGLGGLGSSISGFLSTPLWGSSAAGAGMFAEASAASMGIANPGALAGLGPSLGATLGAAGLGALGGGMIAGFTGGNQTGGMIGGGLGAGAGFLLGSLTPLGPIGGAILGGVLGGAGGGLFGPRGNRPGFYHLNVTAGEDGLLAINGAGQKRAADQLAALQQQTQQEIGALNAQLRALGLRVSGSAVLGSDAADPTRAGSLGAAAGQFWLTAQDARIQGAINRAGQGLNALGAAQDAAAFAQQLDAMRRAMEDAADPIGAIRRQFDAMRDAAQRLGFGLDEVNAAQERAIQAARAQALQPVTAALGGIADFARGLRTANDNSGNPLSRLAAADSQFSATIAAALSGDTRALSRVTQDAETFRGLSRSVFGTGQGFADAESRIVGALEQIGLVGDDRLTASAMASETRSQTATLVEELQRLRAEVAALRREAQQGAANPLVARAA